MPLSRALGHYLGLTSIAELHHRWTSRLAAAPTAKICGAYQAAGSCPGCFQPRQHQWQQWRVSTASFVVHCTLYSPTIMPAVLLSHAQQQHAYRPAAGLHACASRHALVHPRQQLGCAAKHLHNETPPTSCSNFLLDMVPSDDRHYQVILSKCSSLPSPSPLPLLPTPTQHTPQGAQGAQGGPQPQVLRRGVCCAGSGRGPGGAVQ